MKKGVLILLLTSLIALGSACSGQNPAGQEQPKPKPVSAAEIKETEAPAYIEYFGIIASGEIKKMSFKSAGKIASVPLEEGAPVEKGTVLATLDTRDLGFAVQASAAQVDALSSQTASAQSAYNFAYDNYQKAQKLLKENAISQNSFDEAKLAYEVRQAALNAAKEQRNQAQADLDQKNNMLKDSSLISTSSGYVADILYKAGEVVPAGYPVVIIRNGEQIANVGLSQKDTSRVNPGMKVEVESSGAKAAGTVKSISDIPDSRSRTYNAEISLDGSDFPLGSTVRIRIATAAVKGVWISISSILSGEKDYVYIVENERAVKKEISIKSTSGDQALVEGLQDGQRIITEGAKKIKHMDLVKLQQ